VPAQAILRTDVRQLGRLPRSPSEREKHSGIGHRTCAGQPHLGLHEHPGRIADRAWLCDRKDDGWQTSWPRPTSSPRRSARMEPVFENGGPAIDVTAANLGVYERDSPAITHVGRSRSARSEDRVSARWSTRRNRHTESAGLHPPNACPPQPALGTCSTGRNALSRPTPGSCVSSCRPLLADRPSSR
jgi:hypothetical protein